jgi:hypothetical protein
MKFKVNSIEPQGHITRVSLSHRKSSRAPQIEMTMDIHQKGARIADAGDEIEISFDGPREEKPPVPPVPPVPPQP